MIFLELCMSVPGDLDHAQNAVAASPKKIQQTGANYDEILIPFTCQQ